MYSACRNTCNTKERTKQGTRERQAKQESTAQETEPHCPLKCNPAGQALACVTGPWPAGLAPGLRTVKRKSSTEPRACTMCMVRCAICACART